MEENTAPQGLVENGRKHECWAALKLAYERYLASSEVAEVISAEQSDLGQESELIRALELQQRAFQRYTEARFAFLECHLDELRAPDPRAESAEMNHGQITQFPKVTGWLGKPVPRLLIAAVVCVASFVAAIGLRLRTDRIPPARLNPAPAFIGSSMPPRSAGGAIETVPPDTAATLARNENISSPTPSRHSGGRSRLPSKQAQQSRPPKRIPHLGPVVRVRLQRTVAGTSVHYAVTLSPSNRTVRLGPIRIAVTGIDRLHDSVKLALISDPARFNRAKTVANVAARSAPLPRHETHGLLFGVSSVPAFQ